MKKINIYLFTIICGVLLHSCDKFLDTTPLDKMDPETVFDKESQLYSALVAAYDPLGRGSLYAYTIQVRLATEADEGFFYSSSRTTGPQFYNLSATDADVLATWTTLYEGIARANLVLANADKPVMDETTRANYKGEALFLRAYYYFLLVSNWGGVPLILDPVSSVEGNSVGRATAEEVYEQITKDMIEAERLVMPIAGYSGAGRVTKSAVRGVLARVYLYWAGYPLLATEKYEDARYWADKVIADNDAQHRLNASYDQVFINYAKDLYDNKESIWEVEFAVTGIYEHGQVGSWLGIRSTDNTIGTAYGFIGTTFTLYDRYKTGDLRRDRAIAPFYYDGATQVDMPAVQLSRRFPGKWRREEETALPKLNQNTPQNYPILRYADVLLMFAEAELQVNGVTFAAYNAINQVRRRGYGFDVDATGNTPADLYGLNEEDFLLELQEERSRELCFEGFRKYDLIRWGNIESKLRDAATWIANSESATYKYVALSYNNFDRSKHTLLPIPQNDIALNRLLTQNPGY